MTVKLKPITPTSWLVISDNDESRVGLLTEIQEQYVLMSQGVKKSFLSRKDVNGYFKEDIFNNVADIVTEDNTQKDYYINGYPVDFDSPNEVIIKGRKQEYIIIRVIITTRGT